VDHRVVVATASALVIGTLAGGAVLLRRRSPENSGPLERAREERPVRASVREVEGPPLGSPSSLERSSLPEDEGLGRATIMTLREALEAHHGESTEDIRRRCDPAEWEILDLDAEVAYVPWETAKPLVDQMLSHLSAEQDAGFVSRITGLSEDGAPDYSRGDLNPEGKRISDADRASLDHLVGPFTEELEALAAECAVQRRLALNEMVAGGRYGRYLLVPTASTTVPSVESSGDGHESYSMERSTTFGPWTAQAELDSSDYPGFDRAWRLVRQVRRERDDAIRLTIAGL
jgi:hypothetical protein